LIFSLFSLTTEKLFPLGSHAFVGVHGEELKTNLSTQLNRLTLVSKANVQSELTKWTLLASRLCLREKLGTNAWASDDTVVALMQLSGLSGSAGEEIDVLIQDEALKCLVNVWMHFADSVQTAFLETNGVAACVALLADESKALMLGFPVGRLLSRLSVDKSIRAELLSVATLRVLASALERCFNNIDEAMARTVTIEAMRVLVNITMPLGPLNATPREPSDEEFEVFKLLVDLFQRYLFLPREAKYDELRAQTTSCLINVPARCTDLFHPERTLDALIHVLTVQVGANAAGANPSDALVPVLLVLSSIARAIPRARAILKSVVFPPEVLSGSVAQDGVHAPKVVRDSESIAAQLLPHMCAVEAGLKHYVNEFLFVVCDENAEELVRLTGFGNAAGFLAMRGLFSPQQFDANAAMKQASASSASPASSSSASTGTRPSGPPPRELLELMARLEDQGLLKVITKDDEQP
jgi:Guanine nucleotide exchange factor synembryn